MTTPLEFLETYSYFGTTFVDGDETGGNFDIADEGGLPNTVLTPGNPNDFIGDPDATPPTDLAYIGTADVGGTTVLVFQNDFGGTILTSLVVPQFIGAGVPNPGAPIGLAAGSSIDINTLTIDTSPAAEFDAFCFAAGTLIATTSGEVAVEELRVGDIVRTADGGTAPVKFLGKQTLRPLFEPAHLVCISKGALGDGLPVADLTMTGDHGLMVDGILVNASTLVNGSTITVVPAASLPDFVTVYHVETEAHDVILANGTAAETFIDYAGRAAFDNYDEYVGLYGDVRSISELSQPRVSSQRMLPASIKARLGISTAAPLDGLKKTA